MDRAQLRTILSESFSLDELETMCFDLNIDFEQFPPGGKQAKIRELIAYCERTDRIQELVAVIGRLRPTLELLPDTAPGTMEISNDDTYPTVESPAVARPVNLGFDAFTVGGWPSGWFNSLGFVDGVSTDYEARVVSRPGDFSGSCVLFQNPRAVGGEFGSLMQRCPAVNMAGKAVRLEANLMTRDVENWAGLWLRADGELVKNLVFDNMNKRPIRGSTPWTSYKIEVQLPTESFWLNYGILLSGPGSVWADDFRLMVWDSRGSWVEL